MPDILCANCKRPEHPALIRGGYCLACRNAGADELCERVAYLERLKEYAQHIEHCPALTSPGLRFHGLEARGDYICTCGLDALLNEGVK